MPKQTKKIVSGQTQESTRPVPELIHQAQNNGRPEWCRAPKRGVEFYSGFSRAKLYELAGGGHIRSVSIRQPGQVKGTRLFHLASILAYIEQCERQGTVNA
jgi:hypothetical protein